MDIGILFGIFHQIFPKTAHARIHNLYSILCLKKVNSLEFLKSTPWSTEDLEDILMVGPASMSLNRVVVTSIKRLADS